MTLFPPFRRRRTAVSREEALQFYPSYGYRNPHGDGWCVVVQGCVFHSRITWLRRKPVLALIRRAMRVERSGEDYFRQRMRQFLVHFAAGRHITVEIGSQRFSVGPSELAGLFRGELVVSNGAVGPSLDVAEDGAAWLRYRAILGPDDAREFTGEARLIGELGLSVVSDVDDTLKHSNVPDRRDLFRNTFVRDFVPIPGMPELYRDCAALGAAFHYVSGSPWQLYEPLAEFWQEQGYPRGSFHLKRFRLRETARKIRTTSPQKAHKRAAIEPLLNAFPQRKFALIGDSGEQDPEIYASLLRDRPEQIAGVFIRALRGVAVDLPRMERTFAGCLPGRWSLYAEPEQLRGPLLQLAEQAAAARRTVSAPD